MSEKSVLFHIDGETRVATLTLNRPDKLNSFTREMHRDMSEALNEIEASAARALVITGAGRGFCAGQDLADLDFTPGSSSDLGELIETYFNPLVRRLQDMPLPVIAAVNGTAAGAGANLAMACDLVIAARSASFIQAFVKIGLVPDSGETWLLPRRVGEARARAGLDRRETERRKSGDMGHGLARRRRRRTSASVNATRRASRAAAGTRGRRDQARDLRQRQQLVRSATRSRTRPAARTRPFTGLHRRHRGVQGEARTTL